MSFNHESHYVCECGKEFTNSQSFNGHKGHCKVHQLAKYGSLDNMTIRDHEINIKANITKLKNLNEKKAKKLQEWVNEKHVCEHCGKVMTEKFGSGRFCSRACANSRNITDEVKNSISNGLIIANKNALNRKIEEYNLSPNRCIICDTPLSYENRNRQTCSDTCLLGLLSIKGVVSGTHSANSQQRRSKNEIEFCNLCEKYYSSVKHNEPIFNGWDADIIIEDIKVAVLWNGVWHYKQISKKQSLKQIQSRDKIKIQEILNCGYTPIIVKDLGKHNPEFVNAKFNDLISSKLDKNMVYYM